MLLGLAISPVVSEGHHDAVVTWLSDIGDVATFLETDLFHSLRRIHLEVKRHPRRVVW
ncbi:hypothetical protein D3C86_1319930 [compost metagenome]